MDYARGLARIVHQKRHEYRWKGDDEVDKLTRYVSALVVAGLITATLALAGIAAITLPKWANLTALAVFFVGCMAWILRVQDGIKG